MGMFQMLRVYNLGNVGLYKFVTPVSKALT